MSIIILLIISILGVMLGQVVSSYLLFLFIGCVAYIIGIIFITQKKNLLLLTLAIICGIYTGFSTIYIKNNKNFWEYRGKNVKITANVLSAKTRNNEYYYYKLKTKSVSFKNQKKIIEKKLLLVTDKKLFDNDNVYGIELKIRGEIKIPTKNRNFYGFNHKRYSDGQRMYGTVFAKACAIKIGEKTKSNAIIETGNNIRCRILGIIDKLLKKDEASILKGILISYVDELDAYTIENFRNLGLSHILCASGINVVYITMLVTKVLKKLKIRRRFINSLLIVILILYSLVVGFTPSITRAVIMAILTLLGDIFFYDARTISNLIIAAIIIIFINPFVIYNVAFLFSFVATLFIILFSGKIEKFMEDLKINPIVSGFFSTNIAVYIGILPIEVYSFNRLSLIGLFINTIIGIAHSGAIFFGLIMVAVGNLSYILAKPIAFIAGSLTKFILIFCENLRGISFLTIDPICVRIEWIVLYYIVIAFIYFYEVRDTVRIFFDKYKKEMAYIMIVLFSINFLVPKNFRVDFIDVGQGDCAVIKTIHGKNILVDGGEDIYILDIIKTGVTKIDIMIATHGHIDHIGGLLEIITKMNVKNLIIPDTEYMGEMNKLLELVDKNKTNIYRCSSNDVINVDKYTNIKFLNPTKGSSLTGENDNSLVFKLRYKDISFLFTGDLTSKGEEYILNSDLKADVLKVAHHGSESGTTSGFLKAVSPKISVISVGENNKFAHPSLKVLRNLNNRNIPIFRTDKNGQIRIITDGKRLKVIKNLN